MYTFVASMFAYIYCLDCDHYPFCWGECLNSVPLSGYVTLEGTFWSQT